ncbi:MAG: choice-of-anchor Q domain-containing protein, partial [Anaerolineae bacterium]|nr:choice-of-anchor Q domain-containing protein [Anaerolineae bacterium]
RLILLGVFLSGTWIGIPVIPASAASLTVTSLADTTTDDGQCTLREAILAANNAAANDDCGASSPGDDLITFNVSGTITLSSVLPAIANAGALTLDGSGRSITLSGGYTVRILYVESGAALTLKNLTITGGRAPSFDYGGGVYNNGTLTVENCTFSNNNGYNAGGGIYNNSGTLTVTNAIFSNNEAADGGGIYNQAGSVTVTGTTLSGNSVNYNGGGIHNNSGVMTVQNSTFSQNYAYLSGGGILNTGQTSLLTLQNSAFMSNTVSGTGGGIRNEGFLNVENSTFFGNSSTSSSGGAIFNHTTTWFNITLTVQNSTFFNNSASYGGGINNTSTLTVTNSTFAHNSALHEGGGIRNSKTATLRNTIITDSPNGGNCSGTVTNGGNNIDSGTTCGWGSADGSRSDTDPQVGPLTNNGGATQTMALLTGSPAINGVTYNAPNGCPATDQRGVPRPQGSTCDIGAYEYAVIPEITLLGNGQVIADGDTTPTTADHTDFGAVMAGAALTHTFTISNSGSADLLLTGTPLVSLTGAPAFSLVKLPTTPIAPQASTTFQVRFSPSLTTTQVATLTIANNDSDEQPYDFVIQGTGKVQTEDHKIYLPLVVRQ